MPTRSEARGWALMKEELCAPRPGVALSHSFPRRPRACADLPASGRGSRRRGLAAAVTLGLLFPLLTTLLAHRRGRKYFLVTLPSFFSTLFFSASDRIVPREVR